MTSTSPDEPRGSSLFAVVTVAVTSAAVGGVCGALAILLYRYPAPQTHLQTSVAAGAALGLVVAWAWIAWMRSRAFVHRRAAVVLLGTLGGLIAGSLASFALHAFLQLLIPASHLVRIHVFGQVFGVFFGLLVGLLGGALWNASLPRRPARAA